MKVAEGAIPGNVGGKHTGRNSRIMLIYFLQLTGPVQLSPSSHSSFQERAEAAVGSGRLSGSAFHGMASFLKTMKKNWLRGGGGSAGS